MDSPFLVKKVVSSAFFSKLFSALKGNFTHGCYSHTLFSPRKQKTSAQALRDENGLHCRDLNNTLYNGQKRPKFQVFCLSTIPEVVKPAIEVFTCFQCPEFVFRSRNYSKSVFQASTPDCTRSFWWHFLLSSTFRAFSLQKSRFSTIKSRNKTQYWFLSAPS